MVLEVPAGQDILVGDGRAQEVQIEPQRILNADGKPFWRLPGSSLRGLFSGWFHRLAAREALADDNKKQPPFPDSAAEYQSRESSGQYTGDLLAWCCVEAEARETFEVPDDWGITSLFGSCFYPGRLKISDGLMACSNISIEQCDEVQNRVHVAVDRVTGGAAQGMLFSTRVLAPNKVKLRFPIRIRILDPRDCEIRWLAQTLIALHIGLLRIGSSKSSGRLELAKINHIRGPGKDAFLGLLEPILAEVASLGN